MKVMAGPTDTVQHVKQLIEKENQSFPSYLQVLSVGEGWMEDDRTLVSYGIMPEQTEHRIQLAIRVEVIQRKQPPQKCSLIFKASEKISTAQLKNRIYKRLGIQETIQTIKTSSGQVLGDEDVIKEKTYLVDTNIRGRATADNQEMTKTCSRAALAKAVVNRLDRQGIDVFQELVFDALKKIHNSDAVGMHPESFDSEMIEVVQVNGDDEKYKIILHVNRIDKDTHNFDFDKFEYVLVYDSPPHCIYAGNRHAS